LWCDRFQRLALGNEASVCGGFRHRSGEKQKLIGPQMDGHAREWIGDGATFASIAFCCAKNGAGRVGHFCAFSGGAPIRQENKPVFVRRLPKGGGPALPDVTDWSFLCIFGKPPAESRKRTHPHLQPRRALRYETRAAGACHAVCQSYRAC